MKDPKSDPAAKAGGAWDTVRQVIVQFCNDVVQQVRRIIAMFLGL